MTQKMSVSI